MMRRLLPFSVLCLIVTGLFLSGNLEFLERRLEDARFRLVTRVAESEMILVTIDTASLEAAGTSGIGRLEHAAVLENLLAAGATKVAFDLDFGSPTTAEADARFEEALASAGVPVILPVFQHWVYENEGVGGKLRTASPLQRFSTHSLLATSYIQPDSDGLTRSYRMRGTVAGARVPSLAATLSGVSRPDLESFAIDFGVAADSIPQLSYGAVLDGSFRPGAVAGRTVLIGKSADELADPFSVPRYGSLPASVVQMLATESLTSARTLNHAGRATTIVVIFLLGLFLGPWIESTTWRWGLFWTLLGVLGLFGFSVALQSARPVMLDVSPWLFTLIGSYGFGLVRCIDQQTLRLLIQGRQIRRSETLMHHVVANSLDPIITFTDKGTVETLNPAARRMFRIKPSESFGLSVGDLIDLDAVDPCSPTEVQAHRPDGTSLPVEIFVSTIVNDGDRRQVAFVRDVTERNAQQEMLQHQATHDPLTDLPNRYLLQDLMEHTLIEAATKEFETAFLLLDLDRFKEINDTLGHQIGDMLLQEIPSRLAAKVPASSTVARLGGDEFAVLMPHTGRAEAVQTARALLESIEQPFSLQGLALHVEATVGISIFPEHGSEASELVQRADVAMYQAKRDRSGVAVYEPDRDATSVRLLTLNGDLRRAIEEDRLSLCYQPKILASSGRPLGVEALARWTHPEQGNIPPDHFIEMAEQSGLIRPLTLWVLKTALLQGSIWHAQGLEIGMSVNISARNLLEEELPRTLAGLLRDSGLPPGQLTLEMTESAIMTDPDGALAVITELANLGVSISIDDFGTGYSSLGYLKRLPASEIKIDRSFVMEMDKNADDATIVASTIDLAHNLGLKVVAEGVETEEIWNALRDLGCDIGQGYLFSRPQPPDKMTTWLREHIAVPEPA